jgi:hypothetical protein
MRLRWLIVSLCGTTQPPLIMMFLGVFEVALLAARLRFWT